MQWTHTHTHTLSVCTHASVFTHTPPHSCHRRCSASSEAACRSDRWRTTSSGPECPWSPRSCRAVPGNHPPYPRPRPLWVRRRHCKQTQKETWLCFMIPFDRDTREAPQTKPTLLLDVCREQTRDLFGVLWADQLCDLCRARDCLALFAQVYTFLKWICFYGS